ncbi:murein biosynthesis integral membrane protein MurJ [Caldicellulosiruptor naganoensis]|uniref:Probable lipid II flippase MurJ n=1 Tax=Caldicellulosiruptor naganoensis TaxID=29324 RepID=A0ABY7BFW6_9FIRM|nr:murein biosynthesis integral membrane protein MurJ [Caldicellulosiruptor naganoensis]WAM30501.1 murein biosynthesis integral membrane protein MurJ [Caldicellulosiruptor naganoensis]
MSDNTKKITKATFLVVLATILSKIFGFLREVVLGAVYGTSYKLDSLIAAQLLPGVFFASILASFSTTFIPIYNEIVVKEGKEKANKFVNKSLFLISTCALFIAVVGCIFSPFIVDLIFRGFDLQRKVLTSSLMQITFFYIIFLGANYIFQAFLQSNENFVVPVLVGLPFNAIIIFSIFLKDFLDISAVATAFVLGYFSMVLFQIPFAKKKGFKLEVDFNIKDEYIQKMFKLVLPVFIGSSVISLNSFVDRYLASYLQEGSISALNYAEKLNGLVYSIFSASISAVIYPYLSRFFSSNQKEEFKKYLILSINSLILIMIPITFGVFILNTEIVQVVYERGAFDKKSTYLTSGALMFFSLGYLGYAVRDILSRTFYSIQDTLTPMKNGIIAVFVNIGLNIILVRFLQHKGLALGTSVVAYVSVFLLLRSLIRKIGKINFKNSFIVLLKSIFASICMVITITVVKRFVYIQTPHIFLTRTINLAIQIFCGAISYSIVIYTLKVNEVKWLFENSKIALSKFKDLVTK